MVQSHTSAKRLTRKSDQPDTHVHFFPSFDRLVKPQLEDKCSAEDLRAFWEDTDTAKHNRDPRLGVERFGATGLLGLWSRWPDLAAKGCHGVVIPKHCGNSRASCIQCNEN